MHLSSQNAGSPWATEQAGHIHSKRRFLNALGLTCWNLANSNYLSRPKQRERPLRGVEIVCSLRLYPYLYIGVGLSALLGWTDRVMRRPSKRGPGIRTGSTFFVCMLNLKHFFLVGGRKNWSNSEWAICL